MKQCKGMLCSGKQAFVVGGGGGLGEGGWEVGGGRWEVGEEENNEFPQSRKKMTA